MKICPKCKAQYEDGKFCKECGTGLVDENGFKCPSCGTKIDPKSKFCSECGTKIGGETKGKTESGEKKLSVEMVKVEGGTLTLGSDYWDDNPEHDVTLDDFYISKYQVTQQLYEDVMGENPSCFEGSERPVDSVSWYDAVEFCNELSKKDGLKPCYKIDKWHEDPDNESECDDLKWNVHCDWTANGYRLPTDAEWEYAAKGGQETGSYPYAGSSNLGSVAWYDDNSNNETHNVGKKEPNELGLYDMSGNVWEWCWDWYNENLSGGKNPKGASSGCDRVLRGGSWDDDDDCYCRVDLRHCSYASNQDHRLGIRLVRSSE